ncbi:hypothetical protein B4U84_29545 [Westiellopsis prolifica IICB1]|nr:hypothetical protein B4U84_29545 [Westiellopsis prolifica IICB1]
MSLELAVLGAITPWLGEWVTVKIVETVLSGVNSKLQASDLDKALKVCVSTADRQVRLFYSCEPKFIPKFLDHIFKDAAEELQKPLKNQGTPQVDFLVKTFEVALEDHPKIKKDINIFLITPWMEIFARAYFEKTHNYLRFQIAKEDYCKQLVNYFDDVKFAGFAVEGQEIDKSAHLAQIFVKPDVVEDYDPMESLSFDSITTNSPNSINLASHISQDTKCNINRCSAEKLLTISTSNRFVLLGQPGSGKTSLMSYFAVMLAEKQAQCLGLAGNIDLLPILIKIRDLARYQSISILEYVQQFAQTNLCVKQLPSGFFEYWLEDGQALILLDGLDEVVELTRRNEIVTKIDCFLKQFYKNKTIITSRTAGYRRDFFRTEEFPHYTLQLFDNAKIDLFVQQWYASRFKDPAEAQRRSESLKKALLEQERIKILAQNPLLLTIIALIHRYQAHLPKQRYKLYDRAVKTLLTAWDAGKEIDYKFPLEYLNIDDIERLMQQLAYWIHTQGSTNNQNGGTLIDKDELITQLSKFIAEQKNLERHQAKAEAKRFLDYIRERSGLLNEQGQDCYAFVHKTFQEYLAAEDIRYRQEDDGFEVVVDHIQKYLHDAHWREVLLLLIAQQKPKKATRVLEEILQRNTPYEQWLHRNLLFAGSCLAEDIEVSDKNLVTDILHQLVALEVKVSSWFNNQISRQVFNILSSLYETKFETQILQLLKKSADVINQMRLQPYRVALGEKEEGIKLLVLSFQDMPFGMIRFAIVLLKKLENVCEMMSNELLFLLQHENANVRSKAVWGLSCLDNNSETVLQKILLLLEDEDLWVRYYAAKRLRIFQNTSEKALQELLFLLENEDSEIRSFAALSLGYFSNKSEKALQELLSLLQDENSDVRFRTASALCNSKPSKIVYSALLPLLDDEDSHVRFRAASTLIELGYVSEQVLQELIELLQNENEVVRAWSTMKLGNFGDASDKVVQGILPLLQDKNSWVFNEAALALVKLGKPSAEIVSIVVEWISQQEDLEDVEIGICTLWKLVVGE